MFQVSLNSAELKLSYELFSLTGSMAGSMLANLIFWCLFLTYGSGEIKFKISLNSVEVRLSFEHFSLARSLVSYLLATLSICYFC